MVLRMTLPSEFANVLEGIEELDDWRSHLADHGYVVIKNVISHEKALEYQRKAFNWVATYSDSFDINNPSTWTKENLPLQTPTNMFRGYAVQHEKFMWDARMEPGVVESFEKLWKTDELLVSFDSLNVTLPGRKDKKDLGAWQHIDQSPFRRGLQCVQGMINLSEAGPDDGGLLVYPGSHKLVEEFFDSQLDDALWSMDDYYQYSPEQLDWFFKRGIRQHKVCAEPGDLILWDSRTIHQGCEPSPSSNVIRTVIYATYTPAKMAKSEALRMKAEIFKAWEGTTHWPHDNIIGKSKAIMADGSRDIRDRDEPREKPILSAKLLRLAGVELY